MTVGSRHIWAITALNEELLLLLRSARCVLHTQAPIRLDPHDEPEPDALIARGDRNTYTSRIPTAADVTCVIEVADSSLQFDRTTKQRLYASHNLPQYFIINLVDNVIEEYRQPLAAEGRYGQSIVHGRDAVVRFSVGGEAFIDVPARQLLPPDE